MSFSESDVAGWAEDVAALRARVAQDPVDVLLACDAAAALWSTCGLEVHRNGVLLKDPHVLTVRLECRGRADVPSSAYDEGQPIRLDVGAPIVEILKTTSLPESSRCPTTVMDGNSLKIGPSLLGKRQTISWTLLVDGPHPQLTCPDSPLIDVEIRRQDPDESRRRFDTSTGLLVAAVVGAAVVVPVVAVVGLQPSLPVPVLVAAAAVPAVGALLGSVLTWIESPRR